MFSNVKTRLRKTADKMKYSSWHTNSLLRSYKIDKTGDKIPDDIKQIIENPENTADDLLGFVESYLVHFDAYLSIFFHPSVDHTVVDKIWNKVFMTNWDRASLAELLFNDERFDECSNERKSLLFPSYLLNNEKFCYQLTKNENLPLPVIMNILKDYSKGERQLQNAMRMIIHPNVPYDVFVEYDEKIQKAFNDYNIGAESHYTGALLTSHTLSDDKVRYLISQGILKSGYSSYMNVQELIRNNDLSKELLEELKENDNQYIRAAAYSHENNSVHAVLNDFMNVWKNDAPLNDYEFDAKNTPAFLFYSQNVLLMFNKNRGYSELTHTSKRFLFYEDILENKQGFSEEEMSRIFAYYGMMMIDPGFVEFYVRKFQPKMGDNIPLYFLVYLTAAANCYRHISGILYDVIKDKVDDFGMIKEYGSTINLDFIDEHVKKDKKNKQAMMALACNPRLTIEQQEELAISEYKEVREALAFSEWTDVSVLEKLSNDSENSVRFIVALNYNVNKDKKDYNSILENLTKDEDENVKYAALMKTLTDADVEDITLEEIEDYRRRGDMASLRAFAAMGVSYDVLSSFYEDEDDQVRFNALMNPTTPGFMRSVYEFDE